MKSPMLTLLACAAIAIAGCGGDDDSTTGSAESTATGAAESTDKKPKVEVPEGAPPEELVENDLVEGDGTEAESGDEVTVQYVGVNYENGKEFDASWDRAEPFTFTLGSGMVIVGWEEGVEGMKEGGRRELIVPPDLAYGPTGSPPAIGPNETLVFVVDLLEVN